MDALGRNETLWNKTWSDTVVTFWTGRLRALFIQLNGVNHKHRKAAVPVKRTEKWPQPAYWELECSGN